VLHVFAAHFESRLGSLAAGEQQRKQGGGFAAEDHVVAGGSGDAAWR
jgi:hypothetical protein